MHKILAIILFLNFSILHAQQPSSSVWYGVKAPVNLNDKWQWVNDAGYRTIDYSLVAYQYFFRTGIRRLINNYWAVGSGLALFATRTTAVKSTTEFGNEYRLWQEVSYRKNFSKKFFGQNYVRTEERVYSATSKSTAYNALRLRLRISATQMLSGKMGLQLSNEYMQQYDHQRLSFNQNRLAGSFIFQFNKETQLQTGYMWLLRPVRSQHVVVLTFQRNLYLHAH